MDLTIWWEMNASSQEPQLVTGVIPQIQMLYGNIVTVTSEIWPLLEQKYYLTFQIQSFEKKNITMKGNSDVGDNVMAYT